jgi:hypothetical protein
MDAFDLLADAKWGAMVFMGTGIKSGMSTLFFVASADGFALFKSNGDSFMLGGWDDISGFEPKGKNLIVHFPNDEKGSERYLDIRATKDKFKGRKDLQILSPQEVFNELQVIWNDANAVDHGGPIKEFDATPLSLPIIWLGGHGQPASVKPNELGKLSFRSDALEINGDLLPWSELLEVVVGGPGAFKTGGGWVAGGFGVAGLVEGALLGAALNKLTTKKHVETEIRFVFNDAELNFVTNQALPDELDLFLSPLRAYIRKSAATTKPDSQGKFCSNCGNKLDGAKFCSGCGSPAN